MTIAELLPLAIKASIALVVFSLGLRAMPSDLVYVFRQPGLLTRSWFAMNVIMGAVAVILVKVMSLPPPVAIALVALSLAPVPPILPKKEMKAGGSHSYAIGLLVAAALISIVWIPFAIKMLEPIFGGVTLSIRPRDVAGLLMSTVLMPLVLGSIIRSVARAAADRMAGIASAVGGIVLLIGVILLVGSKWRIIFAQARDGTMLAFFIFVLTGLVVGYALAGRGAEHRTVLALATALRHPGVAIAIGRMHFPDEPLITPAVLLYLLASVVFTIPFMRWRKRAMRDVPGPSPAPGASPARR